MMNPAANSAFTWKRFWMTFPVLTVTHVIGMMTGTFLLFVVRDPVTVLGSVDILSIFVEEAPLIAALFTIPASIYSVIASALLLRAGPPYDFKRVCVVSLSVAGPLIVLIGAVFLSNIDSVSVAEFAIWWGILPGVLSAIVARLFLRTITRFDREESGASSKS